MAVNFNRKIELNRAASLGNFERLFDLLENESWGIAIARSNKERMDRYNCFDIRNNIIEDEVSEVVNDLFDLHQAIATMPEDIRDVIWNKKCEFKTEREDALE